MVSKFCSYQVFKTRDLGFTLLKVVSKFVDAIFHFLMPFIYIVIDKPNTNILSIAVGDHSRSVAAKETRVPVRAADPNAEQ